MIESIPLLEPQSHENRRMALSMSLGLLIVCIVFMACQIPFLCSKTDHGP